MFVVLDKDGYFVARLIAPTEADRNRQDVFEVEDLDVVGSMYRRVGNKMVPPDTYDPEQSEQAAAQAHFFKHCLTSIDALAGITRLRYITSVPGQAETYQRKEQQAREWHASGFEGGAPSFIAAEAEALGVHPHQVANEVIALATYWSEIKGPQIEACRRKWKVAASQTGVMAEQLTQILADARLEFAAL